MNLLLLAVAVIVIIIILDWWIGIKDEFLRKGLYVVAVILIIAGLLAVFGIVRTPF